MKPTITDIAKDTGLSLATISKYLNHKSIRPENARIIEESIQRLGYIPNQIAQGLRSKKTNTIALIIPSLGECLWGNTILPIESCLREKGYTLVPLKVYFKGSLIKVEIGLARGKKLYDKRQDIAKKDQRREAERDFKISKMY